MKIFLIFLVILATNIWTFLNAKKIQTKIELYISSLIFKRITKNVKEKQQNVDDLTFDDVFKEE